MLYFFEILLHGQPRQNCVTTLGPSLDEQLQHFMGIVKHITCNLAARFVEKDILDQFIKVLHFCGNKYIFESYNVDLLHVLCFESLLTLLINGLIFLVILLHHLEVQVLHLIVTNINFSKYMTLPIFVEIVGVGESTNIVIRSLEVIFREK